MSNESKSTETELGLDLDLHFLPSWAQKPSQEHPFKDHTGEPERGDRREGRDRGPRGRQGGRPGEMRRDRPPGGREGGGPRREGQRAGGPRMDRGGERGGRGPGGGGYGPPRGAPREEVKLPELEVSFLPEERGVESLARQIKLTGRAYPLFEIAYLVLKKPERYHVQFLSKKKPDGEPVQPLYVCGLDDTVWLNENEAANHVLDKHFAVFYSSEKIPTDPPKGTYTFVAQCGMSGTILGPPNYHDYQTKLRKLHADRFARMPFDAFKSRIKIVKDEAVVKKWLEEQSFRTEYTALNIPETLKLNSREEVEKHFRATHLPNVIKTVDSYTLAGTAAQNLGNSLLYRLLRRSYDEQMRFPIKVVNNLSQQFARHGLHFFKVNKSITHVAIARPHFLDMEATPVSDGVRKIVEFINSHPKSNRRKLVEALAPGSTQSPAAQAVAEPAAEAPPAEGTSPGEEGAPKPAVPERSPEVASIVSDLHWLVHQGHVIEFANGILETAKRPLPRPSKPEKKKTESQPGSAEGAATEAQGEAQGEVTSDAVAGEGAAAEMAGESPAHSGESGEPHAPAEPVAEHHSESSPSAAAEQAAPASDETHTATQAPV